MYKAYFKSDISSAYPVKFERRSGHNLQIQPYAIGYIDLSTRNKRVLAQVQSNQPVVQNNEITYPSIFPGVDLKYKYMEKKLKEEIILTTTFRNNLPPPSQYGFDNNSTILVILNKIDFSSGLELEEQDSLGISNNLMLASIDDYTAKRRLKFKIRNKLQYMLPIDVAYLQQEDSSASPIVVPLKRRVRRINGELNLLTGIKYNELVQFPAGNVVLDPTIETEFSGADDSEDTWLETTTNRGSWNMFLVSKAKYYPLKRSIIKFDLSSIPSNAEIESANFSAYYFSYGGSGAYWVPRLVEVHRLTRDWEEMEADRDEAENGVDWTGQLAEGDYDDNVGDPGVSITTINDYGWKEFDVADIVELWVGGSESNYGLILRTAQENDGCDLRFRSSEYSTSSYHPKLEITYKREFTKNFYLKDPLGNIRVTIDEDGDVVGYDDYYPFGLQMPGRTYNQGLTNDIYKYSGKELDEENGLDWYYFGARYYDPAIGRFLSVDRFADIYPSMTPYHYALNNPINIIDVNGDTIYVVAPRYVPSRFEKFYDASIGGAPGIAITVALVEPTFFGEIVVGIIFGGYILDQIFNVSNTKEIIEPNIYKEKKKPKKGIKGKEAAKDVPSWSKGEAPYTTEDGKEFAKRLCDGKYGEGNYPKGPGSEFNKIKKWGDRGFE